MSDHTTRRDFLRQATASGCLVMGGLHGVARAGQPAKAADEAGGHAVNAPITVVTQDISRDINPRSPSWGYITEILERAGVFFEQLPASRLETLPGRAKPIIVLAGNLQLGAAQREALQTLVEKGGSVIGIGGTSGLDQLFGVSGQRPLAEGWIKVTEQDHPVTAALRSSLHVFGGYAVSPGSAASLAELDSGRQGAKGSAILENRVGQGRAVLLAPDLIFSVLHIQQGVPVFQDGPPAPDDSAPINDGELKAEDGLVLDWGRDRTPMEPDNVSVFLEPISDELREIILRSIFHVAREQGVRLPVLWYWPRGLPAIGHISHDTDGNDPEKAPPLLQVMNRSNVKSTWCTLYPGGYPRSFYEELKKQDFEVALHYDARTGGEDTSWSKENLILQQRWLIEEAGVDEVVSNKNHYTRWESRLDFFRWCEQVGIRSDQSRGPSKQGSIGFPLGGSQPYFPLDDEAESPCRIDVLEVNMLTQDLVVVCPEQYGAQLVDSVMRHHGVAHFLFHPAHILKPNVADALTDLLDYGRTQGLEWWTSLQIHQWEKLRRNVEAKFDSDSTLTLSAAKPLDQATLLFLRPDAQPGPVKINGQAAQGERKNFHGFEFDAVTMDLSGEVKVQTA